MSDSNRTEEKKPVEGWALLFKTIWLFLKKISRKHPGGTGSFVLHFSLFLLLVIGGLPFLFKKETPPVRIITVEMVPITQETSIKTETGGEKEKEKPKPEEKKEPPIKNVPDKPSAPKPKPTAPKIKLKEKPEITKPKEKPEPKKKEEEKKPEKKKPEEKKKNDFESVLKTIEAMKKEQQKEEGKKIKGTDFNPEKPLSISEIDYIIRQISKCWTVPAGGRDAAELSVLLRISLSVDGTVRAVKVVEQSRYDKPSETFFRAAADSAVRAVRKCSPLKGLPPEKFASWGELELNFDPKELIY